VTNQPRVSNLARSVPDMNVAGIGQYIFAYIIIQTRMMLCKHISTSIPTHKHILTYVHILSSSPPPKKTSPNLGIVHGPITCWLGRPVCMLSCSVLRIKNWKNVLNIKNHKHIQTWLRPRISSNRVAWGPGDPQIWCLEPHSSHQNCNG